MEKSKKSTILKEKDRISSSLNTVNHSTSKQERKKSDCPRKSQIKRVPSKGSHSSFSPTTKKSRKTCQVSQSNTIDIWLNKSGEEKRPKLSTKPSERPMTESKGRREKENLNDVDKTNNLPTKAVSSKTSIKDIPSQAGTNNSSTKHNLKMTTQNKETANSSKSSRKKSETEKEYTKAKSHPQEELNTHRNNEDKQNKPKSDNRKSQPTSGHSSSSNVNREGNSHKEISNSSKEPTRKRDRSKVEVENSLEKHKNLNKSSDSSVNKQIISPLDDKKMSKSTVCDKPSSTAIKKDTVWLSKDKRKDKTKTKYDKLPVKISSSRSIVNLDEKSKSRKGSGSKTERNSRDKQENLHKKNESSRKRSRSKTEQNPGTRESFKGQERLDKYLTKNLKPDNKQKFSRSDSNESCELPSFKNFTKKAKKPKKDEFFQKYGVSLPSVEEILKEQKDLEKYRKIIQSFEKIEDRSFELPFSVKDLNKTQETYNSEDVLDCKHLSMDDITAGFKKNLKHVSAIFHGKQFNERHERYFNSTNYALTVKDLCYSTSMIVFDFDQKEHMITLLKDEFDPDDKWTPYFFQVLLPELCLKIFMDAHKMTHDEAVDYLDTRPIVDD